MKPVLSTLALVLAVFAALFAASCRLLPIKQLPAYTGTAEMNPVNVVPLSTNVLALPLPGGGSMPVATNVARIRPAAMALAVLPPRVVTNTNSLALYVPPNGGNDTNRRWMVTQAANSLAGPWRNASSNEQLSGHWVTNDYMTTNRVTFYRTVSQSP